MTDEKKEKLLQAATALFADEGYDRVSIRKIADAAGVNSAMISYYFGGKQGLYDAVIKTQLAPVLAFVEEDRSRLDPRDVIRSYADHMLRIHQSQPHLLAYIFREFIMPSGREVHYFQSIGPKLFGLLSSALTRGVEEGIFRPDLDIPATAILLAGMVNFHYLTQQPRQHLGISTVQTLSEKRYLTQAVDVFLRGIERRDLP